MRYLRVMVLVPTEKEVVLEKAQEKSGELLFCC